MTRRTRTEKAGKEAAPRFLQKAKEFLEEAKDAQARGRPNAAGVLAIHSGISACDALTAHFLGVRSASDRHHDVLGLIEDLPLSNKSAISRQLRRLLDAKSSVEYDDQIMITGEEDDMLDAADRIVTSVRRALNG